FSFPVVHCRCSRCFSFPSKRRIIKRPRVLTFLNLPEDVLFHILKGLPAADILSVRAVHSHLKYLVDNHSSVWAHASFQDLWPSPNNLRMFERAAESGNFEAAVKLSLAYLYNEGLSITGHGRAEVNGIKASHYFSLAEHLNVCAVPFIWLFIRPPWSFSGSCCKAVVYESLKAECQLEKVQKGSILHSLAKVLNFFEDEGKKKESLEMLEESSKQGCLISSYLLWENNRKAAMSDPGRYLQSLRKLRDYAAKGCWEAQIALAKACGNGNQLGLEAKSSREMVSQIFQASLPISKQSIFTVQKGMNEIMRYILVDWLVEVATMKDFSSLCLHMTVGCVDRYLKLRPVPRARLQLLGIACMVICTRFISKEMLTIREAVWLTDNSYKYEELVRMMGEIISALEGKIRIPTILDYKEVLSSIVVLERRTLHLYSFICELSLLNTSLSVYSPARLAAAALLLAKILHGQAHPWTSQLSECTGFSLEDLLPCVLSLHQKCFHDDVPKDYRQVSLMAVKQRFEDERYEEIGKEQVMSYSQLCSLLGVKQEDPEPSPLHRNVVEIQTFLSSPSGKRAKRRREDSIQDDRGSFVTTPTAELSSQEESLLDNFLDWSLDSCSGYEGDQESEGEREGDVTSPSGILDVTVLYLDPAEHCGQDSSDEDSLPGEWDGSGAPRREAELLGPYLTPRNPNPEGSSGYSSVNTASPTSSVEGSPGAPPKPTSALPHGSAINTEPCQPHYLHRRQVKRKNMAEHTEERLNLGFLSL
ncbi:CCNF protein, partial [Menura novaehollandiae]|nr:CCNF protein [Menura novaehollandiae]